MHNTVTLNLLSVALLISIFVFGKFGTGSIFLHCRRLNIACNILKVVVTLSLMPVKLFYPW